MGGPGQGATRGGGAVVAADRLRNAPGGAGGQQPGRGLGGRPAPAALKARAKAAVEGSRGSPTGRPGKTPPATVIAARPFGTARPPPGRPGPTAGPPGTRVGSAPHGCRGTAGPERRPRPRQRPAAQPRPAGVPGPDAVRPVGGGPQAGQEGGPVPRGGALATLPVVRRRRSPSGRGGGACRRRPGRRPQPGRLGARGPVAASQAPTATSRCEQLGRAAVVDGRRRGLERPAGAVGPMGRARNSRRPRPRGGCQVKAGGSGRSCRPAATRRSRGSRRQGARGRPTTPAATAGIGRLARTPAGGSPGDGAGGTRPAPRRHGQRPGFKGAGEGSAARPAS